METLPLENLTPAPKPSNGPLVWMIVSQAIGLLSLIPWLMIAGLSFMAFDSGDTAQAWTFIGIVWSYPLLPLGCTALAWVLWYFKRRRIALAVSLLPVVLVLLGVGLFAIFILPDVLAN